MQEEEIFSQLAEGEDSVLSWIAAINLSKDAFVKYYYLRKMVECIRERGDFVSYVSGIIHTHKTGKSDLNKELASEMIEKYPIKDRLYKLGNSRYFYNIFD